MTLEDLDRWRETVRRIARGGGVQPRSVEELTELARELDVAYFDWLRARARET